MAALGSAPRLDVRQDSMNNPGYLISPLNTILGFDESSSISLHDLTEAYATLSSRIRRQTQCLRQPNEPLAALAPLRKCRVQMHQSLRRDIRRCFVDPYSDPFDQVPSSERILPPRTFELPADRMKSTADGTLVCHYALRLLSEIFMHEPLFSIFDHLEVLLEDVLAIALVPKLPTPNHKKTYSFAIWMLQVQNLPESILLAKKDDIASALSRAIQGDLAKDCNDITVDGLKAITNLLKRQPRQLMPRLAPLLPGVLSHLVGSSVDLRFQAARAVNSFALAKIAYTPSDPITATISRSVSSHLQSQSGKSKSSPSVTRLSTVVSTCLTVENPAHPSDGPVWAIVVLASIAILLDHLLFLHPASLRLLLPSFAQAHSHKRNTVKSLHPHAWRCLLWAFSRIPTQTRSSEEGTDLQERAFLVVRQEIRDGLGVVLVAALLGMGKADGPLIADGEGTSSSHLQRALDVMEEMICSGNEQMQQQGMGLLSTLVSSIGVSPTSDSKKHTWEEDVILTRALFDGTVLNGSREHLGAIVRNVEEPQLEQVRQLTEGEIVQHWDRLVAIWMNAVELTVKETVTCDLTHSWQSLLLAQAQLTQGLDHFTMPPVFYVRAAQIICDVLCPRDSASSAQTRRLTLAFRLWKVMRHIFMPTWLAAPAEMILAAIVKIEFLLDVDQVKTSWRELCADLISHSAPSFLQKMCVRNDDQCAVDVRRHLWSVLAKRCSSSKNGLTWEDGVACLSLPPSTWVMSDLELELWDTMIRSTIVVARSASVYPTQVVEHIINRVTNDPPAQFMTPKAFALLLSYVELGDSHELPHSTLKTVNEMLLALYPPKSEQISTSLEIIRALRLVISGARGSAAAVVLEALQPGICVWMEDESEVLLDSEYNNSMIPLYTASLEVLRTVSPSQATLEKFTSIIASSFVRIPAPAFGPLIFEEFWRATYHEHVCTSVSCPERIKLCLKAFDDVYGGNLIAGVSLDTDSHAMRSSPVPDSEPSGDDIAVDVDHDLDRTRRPHARSSSDTRQAYDREFYTRAPRAGVLAKSFERLTLPLVLAKRKLESHRDIHSKRQRANTEPAEDVGQSRHAKTRRQKRRSLSPDGRRRIPSLGMHSASHSRPSHPRTSPFDCVEVPTYREFIRQHQGSATLPTLPSQPPAAPDDYDSWEVALSMPELRRLERECDDSRSAPGFNRVQELSRTNASPDTSARGPPKRSQSAPMPSRSLPEPPPLRRVKTASTRFDSLRKALIQVNTDGSQMPVEDLLHATRLVHQIGTALNEKMNKKFGEPT